MRNTKYWDYNYLGSEPQVQIVFILGNRTTAGFKSYSGHGAMGKIIHSCQVLNPRHPVLHKSKDTLRIHCGIYSTVDIVFDVAFYSQSECTEDCNSVTELIRLNKDNVVHLSVKASPTKYVTSHQVIIMFSP